MSRTQKILLFYVIVALAAFDVNAVIQRFFLANPDPIDWSKVVASILIQVILVLGIVAYMYYFWERSKSSAWGQPIFGSLGFKVVPFILFGVLAAWSITILYNGFNCGDEPLPTVRGRSVCPK